MLVLGGKTSEKRLIMKTVLTNDVRTPKAPADSPPSSAICEDMGARGEGACEPEKRPLADSEPIGELDRGIRLLSAVYKLASLWYFVVAT